MQLPNSLHARIGLFSLALFLAVQIPMLVIAHRGNNDVATARINADLDHGTRTFRRILDERGAQLALATRVLASDFAFRKALAVADPATIQSVLENHSARLGADFGLVLSPARKVIAATGTAAKASPQLLASVAPEAEESAGRSIILPLERRLLQIAVVPVLAPDPVGWAAFGWELDGRAANDFKQLVDLDITFLGATESSGLSVTASTLPSGLNEELRRQVGVTGLSDGRTRVVDLGGEAYASNAVALDDRKPPRAAVLTLQSVSQASAPFNKFTDLLTTLSVLGVIGCIIGSSALAGAIARPIRSLTAMTEAMRTGEVAAQLSGKLTGELQGLADSFNRLIVALRKRDAEVLQLAYFDTLTGLNNRAGFMNVASETLAQIPPPQQAAIALIDIASSAQINSVLGHEVGDELIRAVATQLKRKVARPHLVARLGSDDFAVLLVDVNDGAAQTMLQQVVAEFDAPLRVVRQSLDVRVRIGWALLPDDGRDLGTLMRRADVALNIAKTRQLPLVHFDRAMEADTQTHFALLSDLKIAVAERQLDLYYQPKLSISGAVVGVEALLRWNHPRRGMLMPDTFMNIAEQTGAVREITRYVVTEAIAQHATWCTTGAALPVAVNISARDLQDENFPDFVSETLITHGVAASAITFEITERALMDNLDAAALTMHALQKIGIRVSLDDYGTGYATLTHISRLAVSELKIDRSFVNGLTAQSRNFAIVLSTVQMAHRLGMNVVAEGIETVQELEAVRESGCDEVQGFHFAKPLAVGDVQAWLRDHTARNDQEARKASTSPKATSVAAI